LGDSLLHFRYFRPLRESTAAIDLCDGPPKAEITLARQPQRLFGPLEGGPSVSGNLMYPGSEDQGRRQAMLMGYPARQAQRVVSHRQSALRIAEIPEVQRSPRACYHPEVLSKLKGKDAVPIGIVQLYGPFLVFQRRAEIPEG
jgi:hypothetical protein